MDRKQLYENVLNPAVRQALIWGGSSLLAHKASRMVDQHHQKELNKIKPQTAEDKKVAAAKSKIEKKKAFTQGIASTIAGAGAGYLSSKL